MVGGVGTTPVGPPADDYTEVTARIIKGDAQLELAPFSPEEEVWAEKQKPLGDAAWIAETSYPEELAYGYFAEEDASLFVIGFRGAAPAEVVAAFKATGLPYKIEENVGFNASDYQAVVDSVGKSLRPPEGSEASVGVAAVPSTGFKSILVTVDSANPDDLGWVKEIVSGLSLPDGYNVVYQTSDEPIKPQGYDRAGGQSGRC